MADCKKCEGWGFERDPGSSDGWARDANRNAILCRTAEGGCGGSGLAPAASAPASPSPAPGGSPGLPEMRG